MFYFMHPKNTQPCPCSTVVPDKMFCDSKKCSAEVVNGQLQCNCGEESTVFDWTWEDQQSTNVRLTNGGRDVLFHPVYSSGTAIVKGNTAFRQNYHYYWEIKILSKLYGTDVMIGVGTSNVTPQSSQYKFCSLLGNDAESWGYSYHGHIQYNKLRRKYGYLFGAGSIIGVHLNMYTGTLEYFLNRKSLGIAFRNLKDKELYPMVCSTAAQSAIRITCCVTKEESLQMLCLRRVMDRPSVHRQYKNIPGLSGSYDKQFFWIQPLISVDEKKRLEELEDDVTLSLVGGYHMKNKKLRAFRLMSLLYENDLDSIQNDESTENVDIYDMELPHMVRTDQPSTSLDAGTPFIPTTHLRCDAILSSNSVSKDCSDESDDESDAAGLTQIL